MTTRVVLTILSIFCFCAHSINAVSPSIKISCTINNDECQLSKWTQFQQCIETAKGGSICETPDGNFSNIAISISNLNGNQDKPIIIRPKNRYKTIFDGTINLNSSYFQWEKSTSNNCIYFTKLPKSLNVWQLFIDNEMQTPARWPNDALWKDKSVFNASVALNEGAPKSPLGLMIDSVNNTQQINKLNFSVINAIAILNIFSWKTVSSKVTNHKIGSNEFNYSIYASWKQPFQHGSNHQRYYLEGLYNFMDQETEIHLDLENNILYTMPENCADLNKESSIRGKTQSFALNMSDSSNINITDFIFFATGFSFQQSSNITLENNIFSYHGYSKRLLGLTDGPIPSHAHVDNFVVINNTFSSSDAQPIQYSGDNGYFYNNLFEYALYSCVTPYGTQSNPSIVSGSINGAQTFVQNTIINYGPFNGYKAGAASLAELNYFANQSNLQHDGAQIQVGPNAQNGTILIRNWSYNTLKYGYRFDGCSPNAKDNTNCGMNCTVSHCVSFNDQSIMVKGDYHNVLNNIAFNATMNNGAGGGGNPSICIRHESHDWCNNHTTTMNNGADQFSTSSNTGCLYPLVGYASNNIQGPVQPQLINAQQFDFRPKPSSDYAKNGIGPYLVNDTYYWIPGRQTNKASFPIPNDDGVLRYRCDDGIDEKYIEVIWRSGYKTSSHVGKLFDNNYKLIEEKMFVNKDNVWKIKNDLTPGKYYWSVDAIVHQVNVKYKGELWKFHLIDECV